MSTSEHINELISKGPRLCHSLTHFEFNFPDVSFTANNSAEEVTDEAIIHLAKSCPNLRFVQLQGTLGLHGPSLEALFDNCADIEHIELTRHLGNAAGQLDGSALDKLRANPHWGTNLKMLRLPDHCESLKKAVCALTKERKTLLVQLVSVSVQDMGGLGAPGPCYQLLQRKGTEEKIDDCSSRGAHPTHSKRPNPVASVHYLKLQNT